MAEPAAAAGDACTRAGLLLHAGDFQRASQLAESACADAGGEQRPQLLAILLQADYHLGRCGSSRRARRSRSQGAAAPKLTRDATLQAEDAAGAAAAQQAAAGRAGDPGRAALVGARSG